MTTGGIDVEKLASFVDRINRLESERADLAADVREVVNEAWGAGFNKRALKRTAKLRRRDADTCAKDDELDHFTDSYMAALESHEQSGTAQNSASVQSGTVPTNTVPKPTEDLPPEPVAADEPPPRRTPGHSAMPDIPAYLRRPQAEAVAE